MQITPTWFTENEVVSRKLIFDVFKKPILRDRNVERKYLEKLKLDHHIEEQGRLGHEPKKSKRRKNNEEVLEQVQPLMTYKSKKKNSRDVETTYAAPARETVYYIINTPAVPPDEKRYGLRDRATCTKR